MTTNHIEEFKTLEEHSLSPKFARLLKKLNKASERKQMDLLLDHPWDEDASDEVWLKRRDTISIYGTKYYDLATEDERRRLSMMETGAWWTTFIVFENLVSEYYMKIINHEQLQMFPEVVEYMHHFVKEEIVHSMVFRKGMRHFKLDPFPVPDNLKDFYNDNASIAEFPMKAIYYTIMIEWFAENNAMIDLDNDFVSPLARAIAVEHHKEEARHIAWGQNMVIEFSKVIPGFLEEAQQFTAPWLRNMMDMSTVNPVSYERVNFAHPAFQDQEALFEEVIFSKNREKIVEEVMRPLIEFCVDAGIYAPEYHDIWVASRFDYIIDKIFAEREEAAAIN